MSDAMLIVALIPFADVRWLDLSRSLLPSWDALSDIARELPRLETLLLQSVLLLPRPAKVPWTDRSPPLRFAASTASNVCQPPHRQTGMALSRTSEICE